MLPKKAKMCKDQIDLEANISEAKGVNANELIYEGDQSLQMFARNLMMWF